MKCTVNFPYSPHMEQRDLVIIGGGPAGYVGAIRASQLGAKVTVIEENKLGGVCLNSGCIPTKFLLHAADIYHSLEFAEQYGIETSTARLNLFKLQARKNSITSRLVAGIEGLLTTNRIEVINGRAKLVSSDIVEIDTARGDNLKIRTKKIILAAGAKPIKLAIPGADSEDILTYKEMLELDTIPESIVIVGGGVIGVEMATFLNRLGCKVSIIEMKSRIILTHDAEIVQVVDSALRKDGIDIYCGARVQAIEDAGMNKQVTFSINGKTENIEAELVAITSGQRPNIEGLGLSESGIEVVNGKIQVDERMQTNIPGIYAAGDITGGMMLAHIGFAEGKVAAENAAGKTSVMDYQVIPECIFTSPELSGVGLTEEEAAKNYKIKVGRFPFSASGMAMLIGETRGMVKIVTESKSGRILGIHIAGPMATTLIAEACLAIRLKLTPQEIMETINAHPSLSEAFWEAALDVTGESLHFPPRNSK
ncbi:dihydrolipoyl dehydrogenase [Chloroflexota bacterium]